LCSVSAANATVNSTSYKSTVDLTAPTIKSTDPVNKATNIAVSKVIKVTFSESIKTGTGWIELKNNAGKTVSITTSTSGNVLTITPKSTLAKGTTYTLLVHSGSVTDLSGNKYVYAGSKTFKTDGKAPTIKSTDPVNKATNIAVSKVIKVTFSESIKTGTIWVELKTSNGKSVAVTTSINGNVLTITPTNNLTPGTTYTLLVHSGSVTDLSGNKYVYAGSKTFKTCSTSVATYGTASSLQKYLLSTANCQVTNSQIKALSAKLTSGKTTTYAKAVAIYNWVRNNLGYSFYYNTKYGAAGTLSKMTGNCCDTAHLLIALERAAGIPARYEHVYAKFSSGTWYGHVIAQVYVNGKWYYADGTSYSNSFGVIKNWNTTTAKVYGTYASLPF
jgi:transglutaminase-like putative cysteine protease